MTSDDARSAGQYRRGEAMKRRHLLLAVLAGLIAVVALAVPALAVAATPKPSWFSGHDDVDDGVSFHVRRGPTGTPFIDRAEYLPVDHAEFKQQSEFERANVHSDGAFGTCAYERVNDVFFREYCFRGQFDAPDHASGTFYIFISADGRRWPKPLGTYRWSAEESAP
jgi:hypothetical protein